MTFLGVNFRNEAPIDDLLECDCEHRFIDMQILLAYFLVDLLEF